MHIYTEPAAHCKPEQGAPYLNLLVPIAAHDVQGRARELRDPDAEPCGLTWDDIGRVA